MRQRRSESAFLCLRRHRTSDTLDPGRIPPKRQRKRIRSALTLTVVLEVHFETGDMMRHPAQSWWYTKIRWEGLTACYAKWSSRT